MANKIERYKSLVGEWQKTADELAKEIEKEIYKYEEKLYWTGVEQEREQYRTLIAEYKKLLEELNL
jgi:hypothetical protein